MSSSKNKKSEHDKISVLRVRNGYLVQPSQEDGGSYNTDKMMVVAGHENWAEITNALRTLFTKDDDDDNQGLG